MPVTYIYDGTTFQPIAGIPGSKGDQGDIGPEGPSAVSTDAGNQSVLGSDSLIYTPDFGIGVYLPLAGGVMSGFLTLAGDPTQPAHAATKSYVDEFLPLDGSVPMTGDLLFNTYDVGFQYDNQGVSLRLGDFTDGVAVIPFIDFYGGVDAEVIGVRIIANLQNDGIAYGGGLQIRANKGVEFTGPVTLPVSATRQIQLGNTALLGQQNTLNFYVYPDSTDTTTYLLMGNLTEGLTIRSSGSNVLIARSNQFLSIGMVSTTTAAVPNLNVNTSGVVLKSSAVFLASTPTGAANLAARSGIATLVGAEPTDLSIDLEATLDYILDRIDALEAFHP